MTFVDIVGMRLGRRRGAAPGHRLLRFCRSASTTATWKWLDSRPLHWLVELICLCDCRWVSAKRWWTSGAGGCFIQLCIVSACGQLWLYTNASALHAVAVSSCNEGSVVVTTFVVVMLLLLLTTTTTVMRQVTILRVKCHHSNPWSWRARCLWIKRGMMCGVITSSKWYRIIWSNRMFVWSVTY